MAVAPHRISAFQARIDEIEASFKAGQIGPMTRRDLMIQARDRHGVAKTPGHDMPGQPGNSAHHRSA
jgi:hypothetical protein